MMNVKIKLLHKNASVPTYGSEYSSGADLYACLDEPLVIDPMQRVKIPTGIAIEAERTDIAALIFARSGLSNKHGIALANGVGVVDSDYRGEIIVSAVNLSSEPYTVQNGERIAQLVFVPSIRGDFSVTDELCDTARGDGGFGSTGK